MTLIAAMRCAGGLVLTAETEEVLPQTLRTTAEKIYVLNDPGTDWKVVIAGAGAVDYVGMAVDLIRENITSSHGQSESIVPAIRKAINELWSNHACYEQGVSVRLLIGSYSENGHLRLTVVSDAAVREGKSLESMGVGDAIFRSLADRFIPQGPLSVVGAEIEDVRIFMVYAMQQAKQTIPGVGGNTRIVTLRENGDLDWENDWSIAEVETFFREVDHLILNLIVRRRNRSLEEAIGDATQVLKDSIAKLRKALDRINSDTKLG